VHTPVCVMRKAMKDDGKNKDDKSRPDTPPGEDMYGGERENIEGGRDIDPKEVKVVGVFEASTGVPTEARLPFVVLRDSRGRTIHIQIGYFEATAISIALESMVHVRPMTHDLMKALVEKLGGMVEKVTVDDLWQGTYYAKLTIARNGEVLDVDCRPSDAIALGLRFGAPIYVADEILVAGVSLEGDESTPEEP
jgi:bifunctional DNase/RNase